MSDQMVTLSIDGKEVVVPKGTLIIRAAEELGIEIPRFCEHPFLDPVAACRQCYVKVEGQRKLQTSCSTPVADGMVVNTQFSDDEVHVGQVAVLEYLLINHPLDCPVCDRGGECPLQDQTLAYGPGGSRYVEAKRTYRKPLMFSALIAMDRERCILCQRCTRFCDEISGDRFIQLFSRGAAEQINVAPGEDFRSPFSGNTVQICPVGSLTATTYRFSARPFDNHAADSICTLCPAGCNMRVETRRGKVVRNLARENASVNDSWLCDKGRFAFSFPDREDRLTTPLLRTGRGLAASSYPETLEQIAAWMSGGRVAILGGGRLTDEDAFALSKFARTVAKTNDVDHRLVPSDVPLEIERASATGMPVDYADVERAGTILVAGLDAEQEVPILHLRIRKAVRKHRAKVFVIHPRITRLFDSGEHRLCRPGEEAAILEALMAAPEGSFEARAAKALSEAGESAVVLAGSRLGGTPGAVAAAARLAASVGGKFAHLARRAGDRGALRAGLHPGLLPGGRPVGDASARAEVEAVWGVAPPAEPGRDAAGILEAAAAAELDVLFLVGADPLTDFPSGDLAARAVGGQTRVVVVDTALHDAGDYADAILPAVSYLEKEGHLTDWEGRSQPLHPVRGGAGMARPDWELLQLLGEAAGTDMGFGSVRDVRREMGALGPAPAAAAGEAGAVEAPAAGVGLGEPDSGGLRLFSYPLMVDAARSLQDATKLHQALGDEPFVHLNVDDAARLGIAGGDSVRLRTEAGEATLRARVDDRIAAGAVFVPYNQPGFRANTLLGGSLTATVALEAAG